MSRDNDVDDDEKEHNDDKKRLRNINICDSISTTINVS